MLEVTHVTAPPSGVFRASDLVKVYNAVCELDARCELVSHLGGEWDSSADRDAIIRMIAYMLADDALVTYREAVQYPHPGSKEQLEDAVGLARLRFFTWWLQIEGMMLLPDCGMNDLLYNATTYVFDRIDTDHEDGLIKILAG